MDMFKIGAVGLVGILLAIQMKATKAEYASYISLVTVCIIFFAILSKMSVLLEAIKRLQEIVPIQAVYVNTLLKIIGITYVAEFSSNICKDAGYQAVAGQIEVFGKLSVLVVSMPILEALIEVIEGFL